MLLLLDGVKAAAREPQLDAPSKAAAGWRHMKGKFCIRVHQCHAAPAWQNGNKECRNHLDGRNLGLAQVDVRKHFLASACPCSRPPLRGVHLMSILIRIMVSVNQEMRIRSALKKLPLRPRDLRICLVCTTLDAMHGMDQSRMPAFAPPLLSLPYIHGTHRLPPLQPLLCHKIPLFLHYDQLYGGASTPQSLKRKCFKKMREHRLLNFFHLQCCRSAARPCLSAILWTR